MVKKEHAKKCCRGGGHAPPRCHCACTCDSYHTFEELYEHRITLFVSLCKMIIWSQFNVPVWRSKLHADGTSYDGWFIMGIYKEKGKQMSYHLPLSKWDETEWAETLDRAPVWDGHTSDDVLRRLKQL